MKHTRQNPSQEYTEAVRLGIQFHQTNKTFTGAHCWQSFSRLKQLIDETGSRTMLDYGAGKGRQFSERNIRLLKNKHETEKHVYPSWQEALGMEIIRPYDPCWEPYSPLPKEKYDCVTTTDALEHIPIPDMPWVIDELFSFANKFVYATIACFPGKKVLADGSRAHKAIKDVGWWVALWWETGNRFPDIQWDIRIEVDVPPITHRAFAGKGSEWIECEPWWKIFKPTELERLTEKQQEELVMASRAEWKTVVPEDYLTEIRAL